ncbi:hypothetical protein [Janibacter melonis]|uniref:hypothetical protein n=1 Tax=Janibacter melonis TaxID=262209 RepID=UPI001CEFB0A5|nr:hypothetical protein [Janibacter melonis]
MTAKTSNDPVSSDAPAMPRRTGRWFVISLVSITIYALAIQYTYTQVIAPTFGYLGERSRTPDLLAYAIGIFATVLLSYTLPTRINTLVNFSLWVLFAFMVVPLILVPFFADLGTDRQALTIAGTAFISFGGVSLAVRDRRWEGVPVSPLPPVAFWFCIGVFSLATHAYIFSVSGFQLASISLTQVYDIRDTYRETVLQAGPFYAYAVRLQGNVVNPLILTKGLLGGPRWLVAAGAFGQLVIYSVTGYKLTLLSAVAVVAVTTLYRFRRRSRGADILLGATGVAVLAIVFDYVTGSIVASTVFVYRLMIVSGTLPAVYFDFFESQPHALWGDSFLSSFVTYPYSTSVAHLIGAYHTGSPEVTANSNYIADGYANLGLTGVAVEAIVLALLLLLLGSAARGLPGAMTAGLMVTPLFALVNSSPFTSILSNGFLLAGIILMFAPRTGWGPFDEETGTPEATRRDRRRHRGSSGHRRAAPLETRKS